MSKFIKTPVKGMPEQPPLDMEIREYAMAKIKDTYRKFGFSLIETPVIEHIENLTNKQGGENEMLIFRILKRGEKLAAATDVNDMCDSGLRYDLTVPLARFYANNKETLTMPFKSLQIGPSFRADRPQKGRFRQFTQCDIDIIGDASNLAEIELISATSECLYRLGMGEFVVRVNDRRILKAMALACGFPADKLDETYIILDKLDKIGVEGVKTQLLEAGLPEAGVEQYCRYFEGGSHFDSVKDYFAAYPEADVPEELIENLNDILTAVNAILAGKGGRVVFDPTLVRGMGYYTGPIFEIELVDKSNLALSIAGGGRYDEMIGKYNGGKLNAPAAGFSIGFERIVAILKSKGLGKADDGESVVYLISEGLPAQRLAEIFAEVGALRDSGARVMVSPRQKNLKQQMSKLQDLGYTTFYLVNETDKKELK